MIGQTVSYLDANSQEASGVVNAVSMTNGVVQFSVNNTDVNLSQSRASRRNETEDQPWEWTRYLPR